MLDFVKCKIIYLKNMLGFLGAIFMGAARSVYKSRWAALYAVFFIVLFMFVYWRMGIEKHFDVPDYIDKKKRGSLTTSLYISALAQSNAMPDLVPKTTLARMLFMAQVCTGWAWFLLFNA